MAKQGNLRMCGSYRKLPLYIFDNIENGILELWLGMLPGQLEDNIHACSSSRCAPSFFIAVFVATVYTSMY